MCHTRAKLKADHILEMPGLGEFVIDIFRILLLKLDWQINAATNFKNQRRPSSRLATTCFVGHLVQGIFAELFFNASSIVLRYRQGFIKVTTNIINHRENTDTKFKRF